MRKTEKIERFFNLNEEEKETLRKAGKILFNMGYTMFTEPIKQTWTYDAEELFNFANFLLTLSSEKRNDIE